jgi:hypothetical protein
LTTTGSWAATGAGASPCANTKRRDHGAPSTRATRHCSFAPLGGVCSLCPS